MNIYPKVIIDETGAGFLKKGQMWMYRNNLVCADPVLKTGGIASVWTEADEYLGAGFYSASSHVTVRLLTVKEDTVIDQAWFEERMRRAWEYRKTVMHDNLTCCRIIFGEADLLPGLTADRYNDVLVTQITSAGMEQRRDMLYETLLQILREDGQDVKAVYERNDVQVRVKEGLSLYKGFWRDTAETETVISENGLLLRVDMENGQKTGYFLDQKNNRMLVRQMAKGKKLLDCFTHTGGFALNAAKGGAASVTAVDVSASALDQARHNAQLNGLQDIVSFVQADVFDYLDSLQPGAFDVIILDPPAFTKSRKTVMQAYNGYKRINRRAMELLEEGGYLITCSCSRFMETDSFEAMLREAASEAGVLLRQISCTQQSPDHPVLWTMAETSYLKFYMMQIEKKQ